MDVDLFTGYNIMKFDFDYLLRRAEQLRLKDFPLFSRLKAIPVRLRDATFSSRAYGTRESKELRMSARGIFLHFLFILLIQTFGIESAAFGFGFPIFFEVSPYSYGVYCSMI